MIGPCAKARVTCTITSAFGVVAVGENYCRNAQAACPRLPGEGYEKCKTICDQVGHAEIDALAQAGPRAMGTTAVVRGHTCACRECQEALFAAGVRWLRAEKTL